MEHLHEKDPRRVQAGKKRWENIDTVERKEHMVMMGKKGGRALWEKVYKALGVDKSLDNKSS